MRLWLVTLMLLSAAGCHPVSTDQTFDDVRSEVRGRSGNDIQWDKDSAEDRLVKDAVRKMLEDELTLDEAVQVALLNNRHLQAVYEDLGVAQADLVQAGLFKNPVFHGNIGWVEGGGFPSASSSSSSSQTPAARQARGNPAPPPIPPPSGGGGGGGGGTSGSPTYELGFVFEFMDLFYVPLRKRIAAGQLEETKARVTADVLDLAGEVRSGLYSVQAAQQMVEMHRSVLTASEASFDVAVRLHKAGNVTDLALASEQAQHERAKLDLASAETRLVERRERLNRLMGLWGHDVTWKVAARLPEVPEQEPSLDHVETRAVAASLDLAMLRHRIVASGQRLGLSKFEGLVPELEIGIDGRYASDKWITGPLFAMPLPAFDQGQAKQAIAAAELRRARQHYVAEAVDLRSEAREARARVLAARERVIYYQRVYLPLQKRLLQETQKNYNAMLASPLQLLQARQEEIRAGGEYVGSLREYWTARAELDQLLGGSRRTHDRSLLWDDEPHGHGD